MSQALGLHHQTVQRCVERAAVEGPMAALDDRPHPGKVSAITMEAKAWLTDLACRKAKEFGYPSCGRRDFWPATPASMGLRRARLPRHIGAGYGVQDPRSGRTEAAQGALLPGGPRPLVCGKDGRGAVRLSIAIAATSGLARTLPHSSGVKFVLPAIASPPL